MTLQQLHYFLAVCEERTFTRAAKRCCVSQPSLSNAIRALELELGGRLFLRKPAGHLTELGKSIHPLVQSAMVTLEALPHVAARQRAPAALPKFASLKPIALRRRREVLSEEGNATDDAPRVRHRFDVRYQPKERIHVILAFATRPNLASSPVLHHGLP